MASWNRSFIKYVTTNQQTITMDSNVIIIVIIMSMDGWLWSFANLLVKKITKVKFFHSFLFITFFFCKVKKTKKKKDNEKKIFYSWSFFSFLHWNCEKHWKFDFRFVDFWSKFFFWFWFWNWIWSIYREKKNRLNWSIDHFVCFQLLIVDLILIDRSRINR